MWREHYKIGVEQIDQQHRQLFLMVEDLLKAISATPPATKAECRQTVDFIKNYIVVHFNAEEMYQQAIGYEGYKEHCRLHRDFAERMREFEFKLIRTDYDLAVIQELGRALTAWLMYHVMIEDRKITAAKPAENAAENTE